MHRVALNLHRLTTVVCGTPDMTSSVFFLIMKKKKKELLWGFCLSCNFPGMKITEII